MSVSTDAILVWGFDVGEDEEHLSEIDYDELLKISKKHDGELVLHCSDSHPCYIIGLAHGCLCAYRGFPKKVKSLGLPHDAQKRLDAFACALKVKPQPGKWLLCSYWVS